MTTSDMGGEATAPLMPCGPLDDLLSFYETLGFGATFVQRSPYVYASVRRGDVELHFSDFSGFRQKAGPAACLVMVSRIEPHHRAFSEGLRARYGRVPTAGLPRITRLRAGLDLFGLFDPAGNWLIFLQPPEEGDGAWVTDYPAGQSALRTALDMAALFRDYKGNDDSVAAKILDVALARDGKAAAAAPPLDRALVLAARAEIAVALGEAERANALRAELCSVRLSDAEREECRIELEAADELERWAVGP